MMPKSTPGLLVLALAAVAVAACQAPAAAPPPNTPLAAKAIPATPTSGPDAGTFVFAHPEDATKVDPADVTDSESLLATWQMYEGLTRYKPGTTEVEPALATAWKVSDDGLTWTFTLRDGVKFHDGTPFNADAVVWNFNRWFDKSNPAHTGDFEYWASMFQGFKGDDADKNGQPDSFFVSAEAVDPLTVKLTLSRPNAPLLQTLAMGNFAFSSPAAVQKAGDKYGTPSGDPIEAGTGPYMIDEWVPSDHLTMKAYDGYWGDKPKVDKIALRVIPDGTQRFLSLQNGEIDGMNQANPEDMKPAAADTNVKVVMEPANNVGYLGFNLAKKPWDNKDCRMAVAQAIDKKGIVDALYGGDAEAASQMMPPKLWGYNAAVQDYAYNIDAAKASLAKCVAAEKLPAETSFYVPPIQRFYFPKPKELGESIQASLSQAGINTKISSPDWKTVYLKDVSGGKTELYLLGWGGDNGDPDNFLCQFFCGGTAAWNSDKSGNPLPANDALNKLLRDAATKSDPAVRQKMYEQANQMIHDEVLGVPLVYRSTPLLFRSNISGYTASPIQQLFTSIQKQ
jgi:peptide/nickel transport system substrate-binding protein